MNETELLTEHSVNDLSPETVHETVQGGDEFAPLMDGDEPGTPLPLRGWVGGRNKFLGITIPRYEKRTESGLVIPEEAQARTNACQIVKLSRDISTWDQDKPDTFRELCELRDKYPGEYAVGGIIRDGMVTTYVPGNCQIMPFPCKEPDAEDPRWGWLAPFWSPKGVNNRYPGIEFVSVHAGAVLNWLQFYTFSPVRSTSDDFAAESRKHWGRSGGETSTIARVSPMIMVSGGASPNRF